MLSSSFGTIRPLVQGSGYENSGGSGKMALKVQGHGVGPKTSRKASCRDPTTNRFAHLKTKPASLNLVTSSVHGSGFRV